jgi:hypothetical protein
MKIPSHSFDGFIGMSYEESTKLLKEILKLVYQENVNVSKKQLEKCVLNLNIMKRLSSKNDLSPK